MIFQAAPPITPASVDDFDFDSNISTYHFYDGQVTLAYDQRAHIYYLVTPEGMFEQDGVTHVCHILDKSDALVPWACKMMADQLLTTLKPEFDQRFDLTYPEFERYVISAKTAHRDALNKAGKTGTIAHDWIETYIRGVISGKVCPLNTGWAIPPPENEQARNCCTAALAWMTHHNVRWLCTERKIYSRELGYAGTLDGLCIADSCMNPKCCPDVFANKLSLADWKTSNSLYPEYLLQTAAYARAHMEEFPDQVINDRWVIRLGKDDGEFEPWHLNSSDYLEDVTAFLGCLGLKRSITVVRERMKDRERQARAVIKAEKAQAKLEASAIKCKGADKYQGKRKPVCNDGNPCISCTTKYNAVQQSRTAVEGYLHA